MLTTSKTEIRLLILTSFSALPMHYLRKELLDEAHIIPFRCGNYWKPLTIKIQNIL